MMLLCQQCGSTNGLNDKFCPQCGCAMSPQQIELAVQEASDLVAEGQKLFGTGRIREAFVKAEAVLSRDSSNVPALALKGDCLEREGDLAGALECYEQVVTIRPDSPLDRIRVAQLRRLALAGPTIVAKKPERRNSLFAGAAAILLLASTGSAIVLSNARESAAPKDVATTSPVVESRPFMTPAPVPIQERNVKSANGTENDAVTSKSASNDDSATGNSAATETKKTPSNRNNSERPNLTSGDDQGYRPLIPNVEAVAAGAASIAKQPNPDTDPDPGAVAPDKEPKKADSPNHQPIIDIRPSNGGSEAAKVGGSKPKTSSANEGTTLIRVARQYFLAGEYEKAAGAYEKAIRAGVSPASANHRLGQCYVNLNRRSEALAAYQRALTAYQRMADEGTGDKKMIEMYIDECRQAIKLLQ